MTDTSEPDDRIRLRRDGQQWVFDHVIAETGRVFHFQPPGRGGLPQSVRMHRMISKHVGQIADRLERIADEEAGVGHESTALDFYFDSATMYAEAQHTIFVNNSEKQFLHGKSLRCFEEVRKRAPYVIDRIEVPWNETFVSGNLHLAPLDESAPCVIFIPGCDMTKEMAPHPHYNHALQRGMHIFVFDGPGQGESNMRGIKLTSTNYEEAASAAIDVLQEREEIDESRIGVLALSFGSYWGMRLAGHDGRISAIVAAWASVCNKRYLMEEESPRYKQLFAYLTQSTSEVELDAFIEKMTLDDVIPNIECPVLLTVGEYDPRSPLEEVYAVFDELTAPAELWVYADQHHMTSLRDTARPGGLWSLDTYATSMDWLKDRFENRPMSHVGETIYLEPGGGGPNGEEVTRKRRWFE